MNPRPESLGRMVIIAMALANMVYLYNFSSMSNTSNQQPLSRDLEERLVEVIIENPKLLHRLIRNDRLDRRGEWSDQTFVKGPSAKIKRSSGDNPQIAGNEDSQVKEKNKPAPPKPEKPPAKPEQPKKESPPKETKTEVNPAVTQVEINEKKDATGDEMVEFVFQSRRNKTYQARPLRITKRQLEDLALLRRGLPSLPEKLTMDDFVFVTAASEGFFNRLKDEVGNIHEYGLKNKIIVYDIGLPEAWAKQVTTWCNVELRKFRFDLYPEHVKDLHTYSWKSIMVAEVMKEYDGIIWWDSSIRFKEKPQYERMLKLLSKTGGGLSLSTSGTSVFYATYPKMFEYLPGNTTTLQKSYMRESTFIFYRTQAMMENIIKWMVLCAINKECIAPEGARLDCWGGNSIPWGHCHRYDQSVINILMLDFLGEKIDYFEGGFVAGVYRSRVGVHNVTICT